MKFSAVLLCAVCLFSCSKDDEEETPYTITFNGEKLETGWVTFSGITMRETSEEEGIQFVGHLTLYNNSGQDIYMTFPRFIANGDNLVDYFGSVAKPCVYPILKHRYSLV